MRRQVATCLDALHLEARNRYERQHETWKHVAFVRSNDDSEVECLPEPLGSTESKSDHPRPDRMVNLQPTVENEGKQERYVPNFQL